MKKLAILAAAMGVLSVGAFAQSSGSSTVHVNIGAYRAITLAGNNLVLTQDGPYVNGFTSASGSLGFTNFANTTYTVNSNASTLVPAINTEAIVINITMGAAGGPSANAGDPGSVTVHLNNIGLADGTTPVVNGNLVLTIGA